MSALFLLNCSVNAIQVRQFDTDEEEAASIARTIAEHRDRYSNTPNKYGVLARTRSLAEGLACSLIDHGVPVVTKKPATTDVEWIEAQAAVRALHFRTDAAIMRWIRARGVAPADCVNMAGQLPAPGLDLWEALEEMHVEAGLTERIGELYMQLTDKSLPNLIMAMQVRPDTLTGDGVLVSTIHGAKGKERDFIVIAGCEEGIIPSPRADLEEERRVFYVAMTRARYGLWITWARWRQRWGRHLTEMEPSRFIAEAGL